jgi:ATP-dependent Clp protease ATP-binding subunit ClpC
MFERFDDEARRVVVLAQEEARSLWHDYIASEHLLLALCRVRQRDAVLTRAIPDIDIDDARTRLKAITPAGTQNPRGHLPFTPDGKAALEGSLREATSLDHERIGTGHLLLAVLSGGSDASRELVQELGIDADQVRSAVVEGGAAPPTDDDGDVLARLRLLELQVRTLNEQVAELRDRRAEG